MLAKLAHLAGQAFTVPTDRPEADGTLAWNSTTIVVAQAVAGGVVGIGYTYASRAAEVVINDIFAGLLKDKNVIDIAACQHVMRHAVRNLGVSGQVAAAIAAVDTALWDLKAKLLGVSLADLFGCVRDSVPVYGSGGFTTYGLRDIQSQIAGWRAQGITRAKIKIGTYPADDIERVKAAREALGESGELFVDANGAYGVKEALKFAETFRDYRVSWFEEPVTSDNLEGLRQVRSQGPAGMDIAAGEYGYDLFTHERMLAAEAVDVLQIDATRCQGYTGFMQVTSLALAKNIPISSHCAPALHLPVCCHAPNFRHMEYFHDHVRIERILFDGVPAVKDGSLIPNREMPGHGLVFKKSDAERYAA